MVNFNMTDKQLYNTICSPLDISYTDGDISAIL